MLPGRLKRLIRFSLIWVRTRSAQEESTIMSPAIQQPATERDAFCATCPPPQEVTALLAMLGFHLDFQLDAQHASQLPSLPAQYHYKDACGTEVIYLAGRDIALDGKTFPPHASRFWLYAGAEAEAFTRALSTLALHYQLTWRGPSTENVQEEVA
jgi:hypothetical protein